MYVCCLGPAQTPEWRGVDDPEVLTGVPEADGIITAAKKHISFMPLELFDNLEYETHTPQQWLDLGQGKGTPGETMLYNIRDDKYEWSPCTVVRWDEEARSFEVLLEQGPKKKLVKRLNLRFKVGSGVVGNGGAACVSACSRHPGCCLELLHSVPTLICSGSHNALDNSPHMMYMAHDAPWFRLSSHLSGTVLGAPQAESTVLHERRVQEAKHAREEAEAELRYFFYLDGLHTEEVIHTYDFYGALGRAALQVGTGLVFMLSLICASMCAFCLNLRCAVSRAWLGSAFSSVPVMYWRGLDITV